jgi:eukaryotic-like serine/threonine-protein kinase
MAVGAPPGGDVTRPRDPEAWARAQALFHGALALPPEERDAFLTDAADGDPALLEAARALLEADARAWTLLDEGVAPVAERILSQRPHEAVEGLRFGPYRIVSFLGEGGMGTVYRVTRDDLGSDAALKLLRDATLSPARRARFLSEQRTLVRLSHPGVAKLFDAGTLPDGTPWFVMELVEGDPLDAFLGGRQTSLATRLELFRGIAEAVQHAHAHAVIHRDLKPSNVLVREDGTVKLIDFGIAKPLADPDDPDEDPGSRTRTGFTPLTPAHAAPEQLRGEAVGIHTDVYALGVLLHTMLAGRLPFERSSRTPVEEARVLEEAGPPRPSERARLGGDGYGDPVDGVTRAQWADLDVLCTVAMHPDPGRRYPSVEAMLRDLDHFLDGEPLEARPDAWGYRASKLIRRNRIPLAAASVVLLAFGTLSVTYALSLAAARDQALAEAARTARVQAFTLNLFRAGDPDFAPPEALRVVELLERGVQEARAMQADPLLQAELFLALGEIHTQIGALADAGPLLEEALRIREVQLGPGHPDGIEPLVALGLLREAQAELDQAEELTRAAHERAQAALPAGHPAARRAAAALAHVLEARGRYDEALPLVEGVVRFHEDEGAPTPELAAALKQLSNLHFYLGEYPRADAVSKRALELNRRLYGEVHPAAAGDLVNLGAIQFELGDAAAAEARFREALALQEPWYGRDHPAVAANLTMLGRALVRQERLDEAREVLLEAEGISRRALGDVHPRVASAVNELGLVAQLGGVWEEAELRFREIVAIYDQVYPEGHYYQGVANSNLAGILQASGNPGAAEDLFRTALRIYAETLPESHHLEGIAWIRLGGALLAQGALDDAEEALLRGREILLSQGASPAWSDRAGEHLERIESERRAAADDGGR